MNEEVLKINKIYCINALEGLSQLDDNSVDLIVTSPPYDDLRNYGGDYFNFEDIAQGLWYVIAKGGILVWVVGDATINGSETGTSFRQVLYFKEIGFNLHDTMIYVKDISYPSKNRYLGAFEYMFILSKGKPKTFNPIKRKTIHLAIDRIVTDRQKDGSLISKRYTSPENSYMYNVWYYSSGFMKTTTDEFAYRHPAMFPEKLVRDHILSWSNKGDLVLDPLCGSGTTCKMAKQLNRNFIGFEINPEYVEIANKRISKVQRSLF